VHQQNLFLTRCNLVILWISRIMAAIAAITLGVMMMITVIDVCGRYFFLAPLKGAFELIGIFLVVAGAFGMGYCQLQDGNIRINVIFDRFPLKGRIILDIIAYVICLVALILICWQGTLRMYDYMFKELGSVTETLSLPFWPFMFAMAFGFGWAAVIFFIDLIKSFIEVFKHGAN
jgi:TRAP-type C4-dicarboxylate transport system permease small subunit